MKFHHQPLYFQLALMQVVIVTCSLNHLFIALYPTRSNAKSIIFAYVNRPSCVYFLFL